MPYMNLNAFIDCRKLYEENMELIIMKSTSEKAMCIYTVIRAVFKLDASLNCKLLLKQ